MGVVTVPRMLKAMILSVVMVGCVESGPGPVVDHPICGLLPSHGSYTVTYEMRSGVPLAVLSRSDFDSLAAERHDLKAYALCVLEAGR